MRLDRCHYLCNLSLILALLIFPVLPPADAARPVVDGARRASLAALPRWFSASGASGASSAMPPLPPDAMRKIEPALLKQLLLEKDPHPRFIVHLVEKADLSDAAPEVSVLVRRRQVVVALQATAERTQAGVRAFLTQEVAAGRAAHVRPFWIFNGLALTGSRETAFALAARPEVGILRLDHERRLPDAILQEGDSIGTQRPSRDAGSAGLYPLRSSGRLEDAAEWNIERIRAPLVWNALGVDGTGIVVANMDTGVDWLHPALQSRYRGYDPHNVAHQHVGNWFDATGEGALYPVDGNGHGTHTMGTIVGGSGVGTAPGARWIAVRAFNSAGIGYDSWIHAAFEWLLAPAGDPALAPDVVNNSWSNNIGSNEVFRDDVRALRQAGIMAVFAAGNNGPVHHTVGSPASYPEALAVGATDADDEIASFSSRGPSPWGEFKPEVSAPGVDVRSTLPGGSYGAKQGTSMAAPHVAGVLALMLQADASLTVTDVERVITSTAVPLPAEGPVPNNDYGWGRLDAYAAVMAVAAQGVLSGVVTSASDGVPLRGAAVLATPTDGDLTVQTTADKAGRYTLSLRPGRWDVTASAFGYRPQTVNRIEIVTGTTAARDFALPALPTGLLLGTVTEANSGRPLSATLSVEGTPTWTTANPSTGAYNLHLPAGVYTITVRSVGYRVDWAVAVPITVGQTTIQHFSLITAPTILLVDSGAWYYGSQIGYYHAALDKLNYLYDLYTVKHLPDDVPAITDLASYDLVVWSAPQDAPGYIGASSAITRYLESGGRLLLSGQDVGFWDGGGSGLTFAPYFHDYLYARFLSDDASTRHVVGRADDVFTGLGFSIEGGDGASNQAFPDVIAVYDADYATPVFDYQSDGSAGQRVGVCLSYRVLYLAFGFEAVDSAHVRQEVMRRAVDWLTGPRQERGVELTHSPDVLPTQIAHPGGVVTRVLRLRNTGETLPADTFDVTLESTRGWENSISDSSLSLASCLSAALTLTVQIPSTAGWDEVEIITATAHSRGEPVIRDSVAVTSKTPAPILLVDDDRWYDQEERYTSALGTQGYRHDVWDVESRNWTGPSAEILGLYPIVVWYTAYDWFSPLTVDEEARLIDYLDAGGRLFFSGQDYLYVSGLTVLGRDYFGLVDHTEDLTSTMVTGVNGNPVGDELGPFSLNYPFPNWSDALEPALAGDVALVGEHGQAIAVSHVDGNHKTVFFGFPFEAMDEGARAAVVERVVGWLSWLGESTFEVDKPLAAIGEKLAYTLTLRNDSADALVQVVMTNTLPTTLTLVPGSLTPPDAHYAGGAVHWQGPLAQGEEVTIKYKAQLPTSTPVAEVFLNPAYIYLADHDLAFTRTARTRVNAPDLGSSLYTVDRDTARPGERLTYTLVLCNDGLVDAPAAWLNNPVPDMTTYVAGSLMLLGGGEAVQRRGVITWTGSLVRGQPVTLTYRTVITDYAGYEIVGRAWLGDGYGKVWEKVARTSVPFYKSYLPLVFKED